MYSYDRTRIARHAEGMGAWDGVDHYWPEVPGFSFEGDSYDRFGDAFEAKYQYLGRSSGFLTFLFVGFDAGDFIRSAGKKPGSWLARGPGGEMKRGVWKETSEIPKILSHAVTWANGIHERAKKELEKLGGPHWDDAHYDGFNLTINFKNPDPHSEALMSVTFDDVEDALFRGESGRAEIYFAAGSDYDGAFGEEYDRVSFKTMDEMRQVLRRAESLWRKWVNQ